MKTSIQSLIDTLKKARKAKKLNQRVLADQVGIPQSHLSKIEAGQVDIQLTSFIEIARFLDLEVMLIPRQGVSLVQGLIASQKEAGQDHDIKPAYTLDHESDEESHD